MDKNKDNKVSLIVLSYVLFLIYLPILRLELKDQCESACLRHHNTSALRVSSLATDGSNDCPCCPFDLEVVVFCNASLDKGCCLCFSICGAQYVFTKSNIEIAKKKKSTNHSLTQKHVK